MTRDARVPAVEITGIYGALFEMMARKILGRVPRSAGVMWNHPRVFRDIMAFGRKTERWDRLDRNLAALAAMAAASHIGCGACLDLHYFMAHHKGLDEAKAREVPRWRESSSFDGLERQVMAYAEAMSQSPPAVTDDLSAALLEALGAPALVELTARVGMMNLSARTNVALGIRSEAFADACGLRPLALPSAGGISRHE